MPRTGEHQRGEVRAGVVDIGWCFHGYWADQTPLADVISLPFLPTKSAEQASAVLWQLYQKYPAIQKEFSDVVPLLLYTTSPYFILTSKKQVKMLEDMKGLKIRTMENPVHLAAFRALGAQPTPMAWTEVITALQQGTIDGQENPLAIISTAKLFEVQKFCSVTNHMWDGFWFLANKRAWERLPDDLRAIVAKNLNQAGKDERADVAKLNASVKELAVDTAPLFAAWGRWLAGVVVIGAWLIYRAGFAGMRTHDLKLHCIRGFFHTPGYGFWYEAAVWLPLATLSALGFTGPIFVTLGAVLFLGEKVHWRRWVAVGIGFAGMLVIVRPGLGEANPGTWMMLAAIPLIAGSNLVAKAVSSRDRPALVVFWQSAIATICFTPFGLWFWQTPTAPQLLLFLAAGVFGSLGYFFITWAFRLLDISALQPITFLGIVWAALMDVAVWGKTSDLWTFVGAAIIVASTSYIAHREAKLAGGKGK